MIELTAPMLSKIRGQFRIEGTVLGTLTMPALKIVEGNVIFLYNTNLAWINLPLLESASELYLRDNNSLVDLYVPSLQASEQLSIKLVDNLTFGTCRALELLKTFRGEAWGTVGFDECGPPLHKYGPPPNTPHAVNYDGNLKIL